MSTSRNDLVASNQGTTSTRSRANRSSQVESTVVGAASQRSRKNDGTARSSRCVISDRARSSRLIRAVVKALIPPSSRIPDRNAAHQAVTRRMEWKAPRRRNKRLGATRPEAVVQFGTDGGDLADPRLAPSEDVHLTPFDVELEEVNAIDAKSIAQRLHADASDRPDYPSVRPPPARRLNADPAGAEARIDHGAPSIDIHQRSVNYLDVGHGMCISVQQLDVVVVRLNGYYAGSWISQREPQSRVAGVRAGIDDGPRIIETELVAARAEHMQQRLHVALSSTESHGHRDTLARRLDQPDGGRARESSAVYPRPAQHPNASTRRASRLANQRFSLTRRSALKFPTTHVVPVPRPDSSLPR